MSLDDRLWYTLLGILIGYCLGRYSRKLDAIKEELHEVDEIVKKDDARPRGDGGFMRFPIVKDLAVLATVLLTAYAAFVSQSTSNDLEQSQGDLKSAQEQLAATQVRLAQVTACTQTYLSSTIVALNERTTYSGSQVASNVELQKAQAAALAIIVGPPPPTEAQTDEATRKYLKRLTTFLNVSEAQLDKVLNTSYPTDEALQGCLEYTPRK